ncbi:hypothetical protein STPYR_10987 [uncultured Stenotrophomonas sp.]|uniref:Uncharacterized protein n=1 Tax=uncultured Stenotrophomonas sp. TaxID=165438 RepID=A0A1Y5Q810_9GAMM|nr:hypothetical protein STPYR_10987 [uncultured Stenotrophomonas sp.]
MKPVATHVAPAAGFSAPHAGDLPQCVALFFVEPRHAGSKAPAMFIASPRARDLPQCVALFFVEPRHAGNKAPAMFIASPRAHDLPQCVALFFVEPRHAGNKAPAMFIASPRARDLPQCVALFFVEPLVRLRRRIRPHPLQHPGDVLAMPQVVALLRVQEALFHHVVDHADQLRIEAIDVEEGAGLLADAELAPGQHLEDFLGGAEAAGQARQRLQGARNLDARRL